MEIPQIYNIYTLIIFTFVLSSCSLSKESAICGKYEGYSALETYSSFLLKKDHTFEYEWQVGLLFGKTIGVWRMDGNKLVLNSDKQKGNEKRFTFMEKNDATQSGILIEVRDERQEALESALCILAKDTMTLEGGITNEKGICLLNKREAVEKIKISYLGYEEVEIKCADLRGNILMVELKPEAPHYAYFTNSVLKMRGKRIYDCQIQSNKRRQRYYKKI